MGCINQSPKKSNIRAETNQPPSKYVETKVTKADSPKYLGQTADAQPQQVKFPLADSSTRQDIKTFDKVNEPQNHLNGDKYQLDNSRYSSRSNQIPPKQDAGNNQTVQPSQYHRVENSPNKIVQEQITGVQGASITGATMNLTSNYLAPTESPYPTPVSYNLDWAKNVCDQDHELPQEVMTIPAIQLILI